MKLYDVDFVAWTQEQAGLLRALPCDGDLDIYNLAEEIESSGRQAVSDVSISIKRALVHLIRIALVPDDPSAAIWCDEAIAEQSEAILRSDNGLSRYVDLPKVWKLAVRVARQSVEKETMTISDDCPLTLDQLLDADFSARDAAKWVASAIETRR